MTKGQETFYEDQPIEAILFDGQRNAFFIFLRTHIETDCTLKMAQTLDGKVFFILLLIPEGFKKLKMDLVDASGTARHVDVHDYLEARNGAVDDFADALTSMILSTDEPQWEPLTKSQIAAIAHDFGYLCTTGRLTPMPESWFAPKMSDHVYADFVMSNGQMLALLVRTIETKPITQEFVLAVDVHNNVYLVKQCELHGIFSKELVVHASLQDGRTFSFKIPLTALDPEQKESFAKFLALECVKTLPEQRFDNLPDRLFEIHPS